MKIKTLSISALLAALMFVNCSKDTDGEQVQQIELKVSLSSQDAFTAGDKASLVMWEGDVVPPVKEYLYADNILAEYSENSIWNLFSPVVYPNNSTVYNISSIFPAVDAKGVDELGSVSINIDKDCYYGAAQNKASSNIVNIELQAILTTLSFTFADGAVASNPIVKGLPSGGSINIFNGKVTPDVQTAEITFYNVAPSEPKYGFEPTAYRSRMIPQTVRSFEVDIDGQIYTYNGAFDLVQGAKMDIELKKETNGTLSITNSTTIIDWEQNGDPETGEFSKE